MRLRFSYSFTLNGNSVFCLRDCITAIKLPSLRSLALDPTKELRLGGLSSSSPNKSEHGLRLLALFRGDGIRTHGRIAPTQPFQDCTLNRSDTPLYGALAGFLVPALTVYYNLVIRHCKYPLYNLSYRNFSKKNHLL